MEKKIQDITMEELQQLKVKDGGLILEDFKINNVISYNLVKSSIDSPTELTITLLIKDMGSND